jgi:hypothetical protein
MQAEIEDFIEGFNQPPTAACGSMGFGSLSGHPEMDGPGTGGLRPSGSNNNKGEINEPLLHRRRRLLALAFGPLSRACRAAP